MGGSQCYQGWADEAVKRGISSVEVNGGMMFLYIYIYIQFQIFFLGGSAKTSKDTAKEMKMMK